MSLLCLIISRSHILETGVKLYKGIATYQTPKWSGNLAMRWRQVCWEWRSSVTKTSSQYIHRCGFHTSQRCAAPPVLWAVLKPLAKLGAIIWGRGFRKWWQSLPTNKKELFLKAIAINRNQIAVVSATVTGLGVVYYVSHVEQAPITGRRRFIAFTPSQFRKIVDTEYEMTVEKYRDQFLPKNHPYYKRVLRVARLLYDSNRDIAFLREISSWSMVIVDDQTRNAFVFPNGQIFVFSGMLEVATNDDQLGIVLGHEMAHAILSHSAELVSYTQLFDIVVIMTIAAIWMVIPSDGIALITQWFLHKVAAVILEMPYNRKLEKEADEIGLQLAAKACFDVRESTAFWEVMSLDQKLRGEVDVQWLSTHPTNDCRAQYLDEFMPQALDLRTKCNCKCLPVNDPREVVRSLIKASQSQEER